MASERASQIRRDSMRGTVLFVLGIVALIAALVTGYVWLGAVGIVLLVPGVLLLCRAGKALR